MKRFTEHIKETFNEVKPGNQLLKTGVTNHYTPIQNILTNINNLFCLTLGIVASVGEDNVSIKLSSSQFTSQQKTQELLWRSLYNDVFTYGTSSLQGYITAQGLPKVTMINLGGYFVVYFSPDDMPAIANGCGDGCCGKCECPCPCEANECLYDEFEFNHIYEGDDQNQDDQQNQDDDQQNQDVDGAKHKEDPKPNEVSIDDVLNNEDKVKAAKQLEILISQAVNLPRDYYCTAIKFKNDDEAIALRWKYEKKLPTGKSTENTRSLIHIFTGEDKKIWVQDYAKDSIVELPKEVKTLIENVLKFLKAEKTEDPAIFTLGKSSDSNDEDNNDNNSDDSNSEDNNTDNQEDKNSDSKDNKEKDNKENK